MPEISSNVTVRIRRHIWRPGPYDNDTPPKTKKEEGEKMTEERKNRISYHQKEIRSLRFDIDRCQNELDEATERLIEHQEQLKQEQKESHA